jgi:hypothetical protein
VLATPQKKMGKNIMESALLKKLAFGFVAGAIAVVTVHEIIDFILHATVGFPRVPWSMEPAATTGVPQIVSDVFWGGLWGILFALISDKIPGGSLTVKGLIFGIVGPAILGVFILVPLITGRFPLFFGFDLKLLACVLLILAGFGAAMGWIDGFLNAKVGKA